VCQHGKKNYFLPLHTTEFGLDAGHVAVSSGRVSLWPPMPSIGDWRAGARGGFEVRRARSARSALPPTVDTLAPCLAARRGLGRTRCHSSGAMGLEGLALSSAASRPRARFSGSARATGTSSTLPTYHADGVIQRSVSVPRRAMPKLCVVSAPSIVPFFFCRAPRRPLLPTALGFRLTPHCSNAHLRPLPQQHVPAVYNASKLFSLRPASGSSSSSSRRRRLVPRPRFDAPPRRDRLSACARGACQAQSHGARDGLWSASGLGSRPRRADWPESRRSLAQHTRPFRVVLGPVAMGGHGHCAA